MTNKEIGKLLELLNEYENTLNPNQQIEWTELGVYSTPDLIHSKRYGFIEWLVESDKIDFQIWKGEKYLEHPIGSDNFDGVHDYKDIIQRLSISDTPIDDLISYLK